MNAPVWAVWYDCRVLCINAHQQGVYNSGRAIGKGLIECGVCIDD